MDLALFGTQKFILFLLVLVRTAGIFMLTPIFGSRQMPMQCRSALAVAFTMVFVPVVAVNGDLPTDMLPLLIMIIREASVGLAIGFVCSLVFSTIQIAGEFIDFQSGLAFASMVDPASGNRSGIMGRFQNTFALLLFLATNAHHYVIRGLSESFAIAPIGHAGINAAVAGSITELFSSLFSVAVRISLPIVGAVIIADVAMAIMARVVPQIQVFFVGMPIKLGLALFAMLTAIPVIAVMSQGLFGDMYHQMGIAVRQMAMF